jgi:hypothetical protein
MNGSEAAVSDAADDIERVPHTRSQVFAVRLQAWSRFLIGRRRYRRLTAGELRQRRNSDTVFIFGSGSSLNDLSDEQWREVERHDTIGFNWFVRQQFVRCDFHFLREIGADDFDASSWAPRLRRYCELLAANPHFASAIPMVQTGFRAINGNRAIGYRLLPVERPLFLWRSLVGRYEPSLSLERGLAHAHGTLHECVNFAFLMGWRTVVLAGVDLYDRRYFWMPADDPTGAMLSHRTADAVVNLMSEWARLFEARGTRLYVYNPRSLLARTVPVWR